MHLDIRTLIFTLAVIKILYGFGLFAICQSWIKSNGLRIIAFALMLSSIAWFMMSFRNFIPPFLSIIVANVVILGGFAMTVEGVARLRGIRSRTQIIGPLLVILVIPILIYTTYFRPNLPARIIIIAAFIGIEMLIGAYLVLHKVDKNLRGPAYSAAFFFIFAIAMMIVRILLAGVHMNFTTWMDATYVQSLIQLANVIYMTGVVFSLIWLSIRILGLELMEALSCTGEMIEERFNFMDVLCHELTTPLAIIQSSTDSLRIRLGDGSPDTNAAISRILRSVERLDNIIGVGVKQKGGMPQDVSQEHSTISITHLVKTAIMLSSELYPDHQTKIKYARNGLGAKNIIGNQATLLIVLNNLLQNAFKYSPPETEVIIELGFSGNMLSLTIKDRGCGVDPGSENKVFKKYFRGKNVGKVPGLGIGLCLAKNIIKAHQGTISIENREGGGCQVALCLPLEGRALPEKNGETQIW